MTAVYVIVGWLMLGILVVAALALILRGRAGFNPEPGQHRSRQHRDTATATATATDQASREDLAISVLVAEDDERLRSIIVSMLQADPRFCQARSACDGLEALALARQGSPDVLLLDVRMPVMSGLELLPLLHALRPEPAIILYTADLEANVLRAAERHGARYVPKSTPLDVVLDAVAAVGATRHSLGQASG